jgi:CubicO group peptidase (beta-lactamase class C family)
MRIEYAGIVAVAIILLASQPVFAAAPSAFGSGFDVQDFYKPFTLEEITPENQQKWPYYKYVSAHWDDYALHGTAKIKRSVNPAKLVVAEDDERLDMNTKWKDGKTFIESLQATQVKGFAVMKNNKILAEFYDNRFKVDDTNLLQSAVKTFAGVMTGRLVDKSLLDSKSKVEKYLKDFNGTAIGAASVQQVLDMTSGLPTLLDFHTPGAPGYIFEIEEGMKPGNPMGHRKAIKSTDAVAKPGEAWNYSDKNTDTLALLAESVTVSKRVFSLSSG